MTTAQIQPTPVLEIGPLKKFAQGARRQLIEHVRVKMDQVLSTESAELREKEAAIKELKNQIKNAGQQAVVERVAYTWFNRLCALRFMDVNGYTNVKAVSPLEGHTQPEILAEAKQGHVDDSVQDSAVRQRVLDLLAGKIPSTDAQQEAYRLLIVGVCNYYHSIMPFLFEPIADYTELLMPDDLLSERSILAQVRNALSAESCRDVEVIGWLYQFYISEKKDEVFEDLKKNKKIAPENIPAATQLFTPHWIVRYLVDNSLGRLWMLNKPNSRLTERMDYYIAPSEPRRQQISSPKEIKICDPACGSGHMLVYAFDLLYSIYEEEGFESTEIPHLILQNNLYGIEIDERAAELAGFALVMKARQKYRRFFSKPVQPNICVLKNIDFTESDLQSYFSAIGPNVFSEPLRETIHQFRESDNVGSLIQPLSADVGTFIDLLKTKNIGANIFLHKTHERILEVLRFVDYLSPKYHIVIANPPYMGAKGMNARLAEFAKTHYPDCKSDLFAMFIQRITKLARTDGYTGIMSPFTWMFLSSFEKLRKSIMENGTILTLVRPEYHAFFESAYVPICAFVLLGKRLPELKGTFIDLNEFYGAEVQALKLLEAIRNPNCGWMFQASTTDFAKIPGIPIAYWASDRIRDLFANSPHLRSVAEPRQGLATGDNGRFVRLWHELSLQSISFDSKSGADAKASKKKWFPYNKGGEYRKWYGNQQCVVNWQNDGAEIRSFYGDGARLRSRPQNVDYYFRESLSWSKVTSGGFSLRYYPHGFVFDVAGCSIFLKSEDERMALLAALNSPVMSQAVNSLYPTLNFEVGQIAEFPIPETLLADASSISPSVKSLIAHSKADWDMFETSWDFTEFPLLANRQTGRLSDAYQAFRSRCRSLATTVQHEEEALNEKLISLYGLETELSPSVGLHRISLLSNSAYRYGMDKPEGEHESLVLAETMRDFISYSVGCLFGRYSLDKPGLILANQSEGTDPYQAQVPHPSFQIDQDNVLPILDGNWFTDDICERFRKFLRVCFGEKHYDENISFIEEAIGKDIRKYFLKDFYNDHLKKYKKRPIYWLFSSPKGTFNALIYLHRYQPDTVSVILNDYLREFRNKLADHKSHLDNISISGSASPSEKAKAIKEIEGLKRALEELDSYEREVVYPLAMQKIEINFDEGVKVNYSKFGTALRAIPGLNADED